MAAEFEVDVLVVGSGPAGATAALALATYGVRVHVVSQWNWLANTPRAHIVNQRAMEVFRDLGIEAQLEKYATPWHMMGDMVFATSLAGREVARLRAWGSGEERTSDYQTASPCRMSDIPQALMEPVLVRNAAERRASFSFNTKYLDHVELDDGVLVRVQDRLSSREYSIKAKYLIGADGARALIAKQIGLPVVGNSGRDAFTYVHFECDLSRFTAHRPSMLYWLISEGNASGEIGMGLLRAVKPWNVWIAGWGIEPGKPATDLSKSQIEERIKALIGDRDLKVKVTGQSVWYVNEEYAQAYSAGRVFCMGDAVHRHPPSSGLGSNTCVQDAFNLAWKLAYVLQGHARPALLDSYSIERAPIGKAVVEKANRSRRDYAALKEVLWPQDGERTLADVLVCLEGNDAASLTARQKLMAALEIKNREFNAHGVEMNIRYVSAAVLCDDAERIDTSELDELVALRSTVPGGKLPHAWLIDDEGRKISTLDIVGKGRFTLLSGPSGRTWVQAASELDADFLDVKLIGCTPYQDPYFSWAKTKDIADGGAILVRPDGVIAWRYSDEVSGVAEAKNQLVAALSTILGVEPIALESRCHSELV